MRPALALAMDKRLPTVSMFVEFVEAGGLMAYGPSIREAFQRAGASVGRIREGARSHDPASAAAPSGSGCRVIPRPCFLVATAAAPTEMTLP